MAMPVLKYGITTVRLKVEAGLGRQRDGWIDALHKALYTGSERMSDQE